MARETAAAGVHMGHRLSCCSRRCPGRVGGRCGYAAGILAARHGRPALLHCQREHAAATRHAAAPVPSLAAAAAAAAAAMEGQHCRPSSPLRRSPRWLWGTEAASEARFKPFSREPSFAPLTGRLPPQNGSRFTTRRRGQQFRALDWSEPMQRAQRRFAAAVGGSAGATSLLSSPIG